MKENNGQKKIKISFPVKNQKGNISFKDSLYFILLNSSMSFIISDTSSSSSWIVSAICKIQHKINNALHALHYIKIKNAIQKLFSEDGVNQEAYIKTNIVVFILNYYHGKQSPFKIIEIFTKQNKTVILVIKLKLFY